ncbi:MAG: hypothetical protein HYR76_02325 [Ignavibacteria bacterium]|nr:hypothetical protein [Ignavibacteria bacterium]MBI3764894.1 hypothetical protein [Ignavibacteriales bacterium]
MKHLLVTVVIALITFPTFAHAQIPGTPKKISYQGALTYVDSHGKTKAVKKGTYSLTFQLFDDPTAGNSVVSETRSVTSDKNGVYSVTLGEDGSPQGNLNTNFDQLLWLKVTVNSGPETKITYPFALLRVQLTSVPYSLNSSHADTAEYVRNVSSGGGTLLVDSSNHFVGVNRSQLFGDEFFGVLAPVADGSYGGMFISTGNSDGWPYYGYETRTKRAFTYLNSQTNNWHVNFPFDGGDVLTVTSNGSVGIGTTTPNHLLRIGSGPLWTSSSWGGALELENGAAIGWHANGAGNRFGMGHTNNGFYIFRTASEPGNAGSPATYDFLINDNGNVGIGTTNPSSTLDVAGDLHVSGNIIGSTAWTDLPLPAGFVGPAQYRKIGDIVYLRGAIGKADNSHFDDFAVIGTLPAGFRPPGGRPFVRYFAAYYNDIALQINDTGDLVSYNECLNCGGGTMYLDGVFFSTTP